MSVVMIGGNERMVCQYDNICNGYGCKEKVFVKEKGVIKRKIGRPDLLILFTNTVSHGMVNGATYLFANRGTQCALSDIVRIERLLLE